MPLSNLRGGMAATFLLTHTLTRRMRQHRAIILPIRRTIMTRYTRIPGTTHMTQTKRTRSIHTMITITITTTSRVATTKPITIIPQPPLTYKPLTITGILQRSTKILRTGRGLPKTSD